jgi:hypothetical protein
VGPSNFSSTSFAGAPPREGTLAPGIYTVLVRNYPTVLPPGTYPYQLGMTCGPPATPSATPKADTQVSGRLRW